ncbi:MAG: CdiA family toxin C-terminal domain-containing protein [Daejeonella sp.]
MDLQAAIQHVKLRDFSVARSSGIGGCHDAIEFAKIRQINAVGNLNYEVIVGKSLEEVEEIVILKKTSHPTIPGIKQIEYKIPALDSKLKTTGALRGDGAKNFTKTTYDPAIWTDIKLNKALKEAIQDAANKNGGILKREWNGLTSNGYTMRGYFDNDKITSFFFE